MELKFITLLKKGEISDALETMNIWFEIVKKDCGL